MHPARGAATETLLRKPAERKIQSVGSTQLTVRSHPLGFSRKRLVGASWGGGTRVLCRSVGARVSAEAPQCSMSRREYVAVITHYLVREVTNASQKKIVP